VQAGHYRVYIHFRETIVRWALGRLDRPLIRVL
jgi:hypothetical protein